MQIVSIGDKMEAICMKCQILFSGKIKKNAINLWSDELAEELLYKNTFSWRNKKNINIVLMKKCLIWSYISRWQEGGYLWCADFVEGHKSKSVEKEH